MSLKSFIFWIAFMLVISGAAIGYVSYHGSQQVAQQPDIKAGATAGGDTYTPTTFYDAVKYSNPIASSSLGSSITIAASDFRNWAKASVVSYAPGLTAETLTLPASSTISDVVPKAGDRATFCVRNATSTAASYLTFAGGTGTNLLVASSSVSALGSSLLLTGKIGCFTLVREAQTATTFDIDVLLAVFK